MNAPIEDKGLVMWTLYACPVDYPLSLVLRRGLATKFGYVTDIFPSIVSPATQQNMDAIVQWMDEGGLYYLPRSEGDDWPVVGVWL